MGLFDDAFSGMKSGSEFGRAEAFAGIMLSAVACDGHISDEEVRSLGTIASRMRLFENINGSKWNRMIDKLLGVLKRDGVEALLDRSVETLPEDLSETAFAVACDLVLADQGIEDEEKQYLSNLQRKLSLDREQALKIFKVLAIKNRG
jgi:tellurite resistance protein